MKKIHFFTILILLGVSIFCTAQTVLSQTPDKAMIEQEEYFNVLEKEYVRSMRRLLAESGYANSGVTMTSIIEADGAREYTVLLHHDRFEQLDEAAKTELISKLDKASFSMEKCTFIHAFL